MNWSVHQSIVIHQLRVENVSNSSVIQIGTSGQISSLSNLYNTGGFTEPAPEPLGTQTGPIVPLPSPAPAAR
ncbi:spore germination protein GerPB [Paenibacillus sp.]|uniref:spore germination protein GerPB n=1 Tax=Paenibacillus sp. TaxID=58172 RepID=UPI0028118A38|nr:spore germination protein GerPB [Paenibacillus sp.]